MIGLVPDDCPSRAVTLVIVPPIGALSEVFSTATLAVSIANFACATCEMEFPFMILFASSGMGSPFKSDT